MGTSSRGLCVLFAVSFLLAACHVAVAETDAFLQSLSLLEYFLNAKDKDAAYGLYRQIFNKDPAGSPKIDPKRRDTFYANLQAAYNDMKKSGPPYITAGVSEYSDLTNAEFYERLGYNPKPAGPTPSAAAQSTNGRRLYTNASYEISESARRMLQTSNGDNAKLAKLPATVWSLDAANRPGSQDACGNCWAWAATFMGEFSLWNTSSSKDSGGKFQPLSKPQVSACTPGYLDEGNSPCLGGDPSAAIEYLRLKAIAKDGYIDDTQFASVTKGSFGEPATPEMVAADVAALAAIVDQAGGCPTGTNKDLVASGYHVIPQTEKAMLEALQYGPVMIGVNGHDGWQSSQGTKVQWPECPTDKQNHAVIIVGAGTDEDVNGKQTDYWLIRNSWGSTWGDGTGHMKIPREQSANLPNGTCAIYLPGSEAIAFNGTAAKSGRKLQADQCVDYLEEITCKVWAAAGYCALSYSWLGQSVAYTWCPATCQQCGNNECQDTNDECEFWASDGYCSPVFGYKGKSIALETCTQSCGTCAAVAAAEQFNITCSDVKYKGIDCAGWAAKGYCAPEYTWNLLSVSQVWCQATCKSCSTAPECQDKLDYCPAAAASGYCAPDLTYSPNNSTKAQSVVDYWCPYSCSSSKCAPSQKDLNAVPKQCFDRLPNCTALFGNDKNGTCAGSFQEYAVDTYWCPVSCGTCKATTPPNTCMDRHPAECYNLAYNGYCTDELLDQSVSDYWCQASCGKCNSTEEVDTCYPYRHVVDAGDTLRSISLTYDVTVQDIWNANNITNALNDIYVGRALTIPCAGYISPSNLDGSAPGDCPIYTLQQGDDFVKLAGKLGFAISDMLLANPDVVNVTQVKAGDSINIPPCFAIFDNDGIEILDS